MKSKRILVVDDDANLCRTVCDILEAKGYTPAVASTGGAALKSMEKETPAVALIDLRMEDLSGIELLRTIKKRFPQTECIVLTGHASQTSAIEAVNLGAYGYLQKPYNVDQLLVTVRRAIERRDDRRALQESEERYRRFFQTSRDCAFITTRDGRWLDMNETAVELLGYDSKEELREVRIWDLYADPAVSEDHAHALGEQGAIKDYPVDLRRKSSDVINALVTAVCFRDKQDNVKGFQGTIRDITERKKAEEALASYAAELSQKNAELEQLNAQKAQLLGIATHELRNPLQFILTYSEFLLDEAADVLTERQIQFLLLIRSSSEFMASLVNDLLDVAKIEAGELKLDLQLTDLVSLVRRNISLNRVLAEKRDVDLQLHDEPLPMMALDPVKAEQVLNNLISNAIKYAPAGTVVDVRLSRDDDSVLLSVQDHGPGIPADELESVFQPFETTSVKSLSGEQGTGLGLAIAQRIVQGHRGEIWVESEVGEGATFYLSLPIRDDKGPDCPGETSIE